MRISFKQIASAALILTAVMTHAQNNTEDYVFKFPLTPSGIDRYGTTVTGYNDHNVYTMSGKPMTASTSVINKMKMNPTGAYFAYIAGQGKKAKVKVYRNHSDIASPAVWKYSSKKMGIPSAFAFTPDGRSLMVAAPGKINRLNQRGTKFELVDTVPLAGPATDIILSNNGYYAATPDGKVVRVYNLQENTLRTTISPEETVTDVMFTDDSSEMGVLTADGVLRVYDTRTFLIKNSYDELGEGLSFCFNADGKYAAVATDPHHIVVFNLITPDEEEKIYIEIPEGGVNDILFINDAFQNAILTTTANNALKARRMAKLTPFYGKLVSGGADEMMNEWMKMRPDETMEEYRLRVNPESIARQRQLFEDEIATKFAPDLVSMAGISLGEYDSRHELQEVIFSNMPSIYLPVPNADKPNMTDASTLEFRDVRYGIMPNDKFEMIYANVYNTSDGKIYTFDNINRAPLAFMVDDEEDPMTLEVIQQQQMEEMRLQEIKQRVMEEAKRDNVISDHTNITVESRLEPAFNANGDKILNYRVKFTYEVEPEYSVREDFGPGKYHVNESGAATSMLSIVKEALENDLSQYVKEGKKLNIILRGTADSSPIRSRIAYDGSYGDFEDEPVTKDGQLTGITVTKATGITQNEQLAFLRAAGVKEKLLNSINNLNSMNPNFEYSISVAEGKGAEFRRITAEFVFVDVF